MYNILKNKIYSHFYSTFVKESYLKVSEVPNKEEVYYKKKKKLLVVLVKDEEIGSQIYEIIKALKDRNEQINTGRISFKVVDYIVDKQNTVQMFSLNFAYDNEISWNDLSKPEKLQEFGTFVDVMQIKGYILNEAKFEDEKCSSLSALLSFFDLTGTKSEKVKGCIIKYIHYALSGGSNFDKFYTEITNRNEIVHISEFPYSLPIIKLCYNYFSTGNIPEYISGILEKENILQCSENEYNDYLVLTNDNLTDYMTVTDTNNDYTIYAVNSDESIKIYNTISSKFSDFLRDKLNFLKYNMGNCLEQIDRLIIDCNGNIIGYKFTLKDLDGYKLFTTLNVPKFVTSQMLIFQNIWELEKQLKELNSYRIKFGEEENDFDIEKSLTIMSPGYRYTVVPYQNTIKDLFNLVTQNPCIIEKQLIDLLFKMLLNYLNNEYGEVHDEQEILDKKEIRYLTPGLAKQFVNYVLNSKYYDYYEAYKSFSDLSENERCSTCISIIYDKRFVYDPTNVSFVFDYEVENQKDIKLKKGTEEILADGSKLLIFDSKTNIKKLQKYEEKIINELDSIGCDEYRRDGKILKVDKVIYSKEIDSNGMYKLIGYITRPLKGELLTDDFILSLNNKELLKFIVYYLGIFDKVQNQHISWDKNTVWVDKQNDTFTFYFDILNSNFNIEKTYTDSFSWIKDYLIDKGYNPNAFMGLEDFQPTTNFAAFGRYDYSSLLVLSISLDSYCEDHKIYYDSTKMACPACLESKFFVTSETKNNIIKLFEDSIATHYRIDISDGFKPYNLKVYKKSCNINIQEVENNIDEIVSRRIIHKDLNLGQKCFVPYKKAFNSKSEFIGYIYEAVDFDNPLDIDMDNITIDPALCINLNDSRKFKNLPRLKCLIRLLSQVEELIKNGFTFIDNPFTNVYLSKEHKKQVQILNIEFAKKRRKKRTNLKNSKNWAYQYVSNIISLDDTLELKEHSSEFNSLYEQMLELESNLTNYCSIHKLYYDRKYAFCPKCISKKEFDELDKEFVNINEITSKKPIAEGGESILYPYENNSIAKIFKTDEESEVDILFKSIILTRIWRKREILENLNIQNHKVKFIYAKKVLFSRKNKLVGYIMDEVENGFSLSVLRNKEKIEELGLTRKDVLEILITVGEGIKILHDKADIYIGDLNGDNILFDINKNVYFLDFDGMGIDDIAPTFFTDEYLDPLSEGNITMKDDWYSFAIQAFHYLTFVHPFNGIYSTVIDGQKVNLEIVDKMAQRISLLGNHGIEVPDVAESWDWMEDDLEKIFLNIFEGNVRESIVPQLKKQYNVLYGKNVVQSTDNNKSFSINSKYLAIPAKRFLYEPIQVINDYSIVSKEVVSEDHENGFVSILGRKDIEHTISCSPIGINNVLLSDDEDFAFIIYSDKILVVDLKLNVRIHTEIGNAINNAVLNEDNLYYTDIKNGKNVIFNLKIIRTPEEVQVKKKTIDFLAEQETRGFLAKFNSKFVIVKHSLDGSEDEIYCNEEKLCSITCNNSTIAYNIIYDDASNFWLVINNEGNGIIIKTLLGTYERINIRDIIGNRKFNINNISFTRGYIYVPTENCLYLINTIDQTKTKKMEVDKIITPDSRLYDINPKGFSVIADNKFYDIRKK